MDDRHEQFADWITRYYSSHKYIPDGHSDGELIGRLIRCKDCKHYREPNDEIRISYCWYHTEGVNPEEDYCSWAERRRILSPRRVKDDQTD